MSTRAAEQFTTIRTEGGLLPPGLLARVASGDGTLPGLTPDAYHLTPGEKFGEVINRSWLRLVGAWTGFRESLAGAKSGDPATGLTRDRWLLVLFAELGYGRLPPARAMELDGVGFPVSHSWGPTPIHLVGAGIDLDRRTPGVAGAARSSPHSLVQELLNRDPAQLWGFVSNGLHLRILRDNLSLTRQAYVEFDLEAMMDAEIYSDFVVLWLLAHQSRVEAAEPTNCWLERWSIEARSHGTRALDHLRDSVEEAIVALGRGFLSHPTNSALVVSLRDGTIRPIDYYRQLLRVVYRLLFLLVAEERDLLLLPEADPQTRQRYRDYYSLRRLRELAERRRGTAHCDLWVQIRTVVGFLGSPQGCPALGLPALGSFLFSAEATAALNDGQIANADLLTAIRALSGRSDAGYRQRHDYRNLGVEELGSVYESLLELHPEVNVAPALFTLSHGGTERRATGSHYTPPTILKQVLDFALEPAINRALGADDPEAALLDLRVLDPAAGSGHFLIAAAHRVARALASVRTGELEATPAEVRRALREIVARCLYGTDLNPMAVELCRVALWLETLEPGKPLSFLDHHIRVGNSLLGVPLGTTVTRNRVAVDSRRAELEKRVADVQGPLRTSSAIDAGFPPQNELTAMRRELGDCEYDSWADAIPDAAFKAGDGDDRDIAKKVTAENRKGRHSGQLLLAPVLIDLPADLVDVFRRIGAGAEDSVAEVTIRAAEFEGAQRREEYRHLVALADTWTAAFFWPLVPAAAPTPTQEWFATLKTNAQALPAETVSAVSALTADRRFFHFELAWPEVFTSDRGGFDVVIGNPPYLGGMRISTTFGDKVLNFLKVNHPAQTGGRIDLAAYFVRRGFDLLRHNGELCFITTNSIAQGDTKDAGLLPVTQWGAVIADAVSSTPWEGQATVTVAIVHLHFGEWSQKPTLNGAPVDQISCDLSAGTTSEPRPIPANEGVVSVGTNVLGEGFWIDAQTRARLLADDPRNAAVVKPFIGGRHAMQSPDPAVIDRWVIDFEGRTLEASEVFQAPMTIVRTKVKPRRDQANRQRYRDYWWQLGERSARLYDRIHEERLARVIGIPTVSKVMLPVWLPSQAIFQDALFVFVSDDWTLFGVLTSVFHWLWAAKFCTTMRADPRYNPSRIFLTLPLPELTPDIAAAAEHLDGTRSDLMRLRRNGITSIYNLVFDPDCTDSQVVVLRNAHVSLDRAVARAYGWDDLCAEFDHGHHETRFGVRWIPSPTIQREIERRLLELNHQRVGTEMSPAQLAEEAS